MAKVETRAFETAQAKHGAQSASDQGQTSHKATRASARKDLQTEQISEAESLRRMITFTKREAEMKDRTFCAYLLDLALNALDEDTEEMNTALRAKITPMPTAEQTGKAGQPG